MITPLLMVISFDLRVVWYVALAALARLPGFCLLSGMKNSRPPGLEPGSNVNTWCFLGLAVGQLNCAATTLTEVMLPA